MKFKRKYVGPIHHTRQDGVSVLQGLFEWGCRVDAQEQVRLVFLAQGEKRARFACERDLHASERENGW